MPDRSRWPISIHRLGEESVHPRETETTPEQRLAMVAELSAQSFRLTGAAIPDYAREDAPIVVRPLRG